MKDPLPSGKTLIFILIVASIASFMSALDGTIVNIALPSIAKVIAGLLLIIGKITDTIGLKKIFLGGFAISATFLPKGLAWVIVFFFHLFMYSASFGSLPFCVLMFIGQKSPDAHIGTSKKYRNEKQICHPKILTRRFFQSVRYAARPFPAFFAIFACLFILSPRYRLLSHFVQVVQAYRSST